ncbi:hypothetical protein D3C76_1638020 [compost metagenome]
MILDQPGNRTDDGGFGHHADVVVSSDSAYIFYFTHPGKTNTAASDGKSTYEQRRSSVQVARLDVRDGVLVCDRNEPFELALKSPK